MAHIAHIRSTFALFITLADLIGTSALLTLSIYCRRHSYPRRLSEVNPIHYNLRGSKMGIINTTVGSFKNSIVYNSPSFNEDEFVLPKNNVLNHSYPKKMRKLSTYYSRSIIEDVPMIIFILSFVGIFFSFVLMFSFCIDKNECCGRESREGMEVCCCFCCICDEPDRDCKCEGGNGGAGDGLLIILAVVLVVIIIAFSIKACGKHISRYVAIISEFLINFACIIFAGLYVQKEPNYLVWIIIALSSILALINLLAVLLPNLSCCISLTYEYKTEPGNINKPLVPDEHDPFYEPPTPTPTTGTTVPPPAPYNTPTYIPPSGYSSGKGGIYDVPPPPASTN